MKKLLDSIVYIFLNYFVAYIPLWHIRKLLYMAFGMKIGKGSRIYMKCIIRTPWRIKIGNNTFINENSYLDGRGGLTIGNNTSISLFTMLITASHDMHSKTFEYRKGEIIIGDNVWIGARAIILDKSTIRNECVIGAGSVIKGDTIEGKVYAGNPGRIVKDRNLNGNYTLSYHDYLR